ncbi:OmpA family protein [Granulosicoccus antarcticus]|uniref:Outer membrane porin F n=1 Tax=Granulosicoccus antarcticus IMCC3135 TaxID=1192854 RepID=A0A2Z2NMY1_9GAMM|nr:OmpA family protein [Granulosicoccus antarcticus]ASJ70240.1 Outer membrane porin F [Granulosicoccus antarcticus IMCC3135]
MANRLRIRPIDARKSLNLGLLLLASLTSSALQAESISDRLIVLDPDGRHYVAQQWLATSANPVVATLPAERVTQETRFAGPDWQAFASIHEQNPDQLSLSSGSVMTRYQHRYEQGLSEPYPGVFELNTALEQLDIRFTEAEEVQWSLTWILPGNVSLLKLDADASLQPSTSEQVPQTPSGDWQTRGQVVTYRQTGGQLPALRLRFSLSPFESLVTEPCSPGSTSDERCSPDIDDDGVPDSRDLCLPPTSEVLALRPTPALAIPVPSASVLKDRADELGCANEDPVRLTGVRFASRQSYLDVASREVLERVARALQKMPESVFEIRSHTDNAGRVDINQRDSRERAEAVRYYLQLLGVEPAQLKARGMGESAPAYDNTLAAGRRANRRVELHRLK